MIFLSVGFQAQSPLCVCFTGKVVIFDKTHVPETVERVRLQLLKFAAFTKGCHPRGLPAEDIASPVPGVEPHRGPV